MTAKIVLKKTDKGNGITGLVFDASDVLVIRKEFRIIGSFLGLLGQFPLQNTCLGLPLKLSLEELMILHDEFFDRVEFDAPVKDPAFERFLSPTRFTALGLSTMDKKDVDRYLIFHEFWRQSYFISTGVKYGADFALYKADPFTVHAEYVVSIFSSDTCLSGTELACLGRISHSVRKSHLLVYWDHELSEMKSLVLKRSKP